MLEYAPTLPHWIDRLIYWDYLREFSRNISNMFCIVEALLTEKENTRTFCLTNVMHNISMPALPYWRSISTTIWAREAANVIYEGKGNIIIRLGSSIRRCWVRLSPDYGAIIVTRYQPFCAELNLIFFSAKIRYLKARHSLSWWCSRFHVHR